MPDVYDPIAAQMSVVSAKERLADFITDLAGRTNQQIWLYQTNVAPSPTNTLANFTIATFSGYAGQAIGAFGAVGVDPSNNAFATAGIFNFACNGGGVNNQIYGSLHVATPAGALQASATNTGSGTGYSPIFTIVAAGLGYTAPPAITLNGAGGSGAAAHAVLNPNGSIQEIILDSAGVGYSTYPVVIAAPYELIKQNVLSATGISMALATDQVPTYTQLIEPSGAA
jgi:hypothetical protein